MKTLIELTVKELDNDLVERIKSLFAGRENAKLTISVNEDDASYVDTLRRSVNDLEARHNLVSFTMEEFEAYGNNRKP